MSPALTSTAGGSKLVPVKVGMDDAVWAECRGYGKLILFGEHFVVYKKPALVAAVAAATTARVEVSHSEWSHGLIIEDERPAVNDYKVTKAAEMLESTNLVLKHLGVDPSKQGIKITLGGDLCCASGIGASAANCVSLARALSVAFGMNLTEEQVNEAAYEGEKGYHGTPSGIDNTASTYGGVLKFQRTEGAPIFENKRLASECRIVYATTGITASTTKVVGDIAQRRENEPEWYNAIEAKYVSVFDKAEAALDAGDWATVGSLANENHSLCQELGVSCKELDALVIAAREAGAIGAKMSGTGRGGLMWALTPDAETQEKVFAAMSAIAPVVWKTTFANAPGSKL